MIEPWTINNIQVVAQLLIVDVWKKSKQKK